MAARLLRSPIRWYGGKGKMVSRLLPLVPAGGKPYVEPFCGGASLFFARDPAPVEVLNDLDERIVTLFRCLQDKEQFAELKHRLKYTLYSRSEFCRALEILNDRNASQVMKAWAAFVAFNQGFAGIAKTPGDWGRVFVSNRGMARSTSSWIVRLELLEAYNKRLQRVQIDCRDALEVIRYWDCDDAVFYVDPPYHPETRVKGKTRIYEHEQHASFYTKLTQALLSVSGAVVLSGYEHECYEPLKHAGWNTIRFQTACSAAGRVRGSNLREIGSVLKHVPRVECVWLNAKAMEKIGRKPGERPLI